MSAIECLHIDPAKKSEYARTINEVYKDWYHTEWYFIGFKQFLEISRASFIMYLRYFLESAAPNGDINIAETKSKIESLLGDDFRQHKFDNAVYCIQENRWESIRQQGNH